NYIPRRQYVDRATRADLRSNRINYIHQRVLRSADKHRSVSEWQGNHAGRIGSEKRLLRNAVVEFVSGINRSDIGPEKGRKQRIAADDHIERHRIAGDVDLFQRAVAGNSARAVGIGEQDVGVVNRLRIACGAYDWISDRTVGIAAGGADHQRAQQSGSTAGQLPREHSVSTSTRDKHLLYLGRSSRPNA